MITSIIINAATGRMGKELIRAVVSDANSVIASAMARNGHPLIGTDVGFVIGANPQGRTISSDYNDAFNQGEVIIDFSLPEHTMSTLQKAVAANCPMVIGTTGFDQEQLKTIKAASEIIPVMLAANYSLGVNSLIQLVKQASELLGEQADIEIFEAHHKHKVDSPSGTALAIGEAIAETKDQPLEDLMVTDRAGKRSDDTIGFSVMRAGEIVGTHEVTFALNGELLSIKHEAQSRQCFAQGALTAAKWLINQKPGLYNLQDMLKS